MKPARDIEVGDRITRTRNGKPEVTLTVTAVLSRRGGVRRVQADGGAVVSLNILPNGSVRHVGGVGWSSIDYRRAESGDDEKVREHNQRSTLASMCYLADVYAWPIEDVRRVLAAWPGETK